MAQFTAFTSLNEQREANKRKFCPVSQSCVACLAILTDNNLPTTVSGFGASLVKTEVNSFGELLIVICLTCWYCK